MRLIDAEKLKKTFIGNRYGTKAIEYYIDNAPTVDAVPVVRCKECKFHRGGYCLGTGHFDMPTEDDGFCSWGERREDAEKID